MSVVMLLRDVHTDVGIFSAGCEFEAQACPDGWLVRLLPRQLFGPDHTMLLGFDDVCVYEGLAS